MSNATMTADLSVYIKSVIAGGVAVFLCAMIVVFTALVAILWMSRRAEGDTVIGWDFVFFAKTPLAWITFLLAFAVGFYWQYHRSVTH
jgi:cell division protein FtsL